MIAFVSALGMRYTVRKHRGVFGTDEVRDDQKGRGEDKEREHHFRGMGCRSVLKGREKGGRTPHSLEEGFSVECRNLWRTARTL